MVKKFTKTVIDRLVEHHPGFRQLLERRLKERSVPARVAERRPGRAYRWWHPTQAKRVRTMMVGAPGAGFSWRKTSTYRAALPIRSSSTSL